MPLKSLVTSDADPGSRRDAMAPLGMAPDQVREAMPADCAEIAEIYNQAIRSGVATMETQLVGAGCFEHKLAELSPREALLVAEGPTGVAGWGIVKAYSDRPGYSVACETSLYLAEAEKGRGLGTALLDALVARAAELGYRHLVAKIMGVNDGSIAFHARRGYEHVGRQRNIGRLNGIYHDVVIMQRLLSDEP